MSDKRSQLLDHATSLFIRHGFISVTMDEVAKTAGVSKKTVYQFFSNKAVLVEAVVGQLVAKSKLIINSNTNDSFDPVQELILQQSLFKHWIDLRFLFNDLMLKRFPRALRTLDDFKTGYMKNVIQTNLSLGIAKGYYREDLNLQVTVDIYVTVTDHFIFNNAKGYAIVFEALQLFINGITTANGRSLVKKYQTYSS